MDEQRGADAQPTPVQTVQLLYDALQQQDAQPFAALIRPEALWEANDAVGRGGTALFARLIAPLSERRTLVHQVVAQGGTVIVLGTQEPAAGTHSSPALDFAHVWQLHEGRVIRVRLFAQRSFAASDE